MSVIQPLSLFHDDPLFHRSYFLYSRETSKGMRRARLIVDGERKCDKKGDILFTRSTHSDSMEIYPYDMVGDVKHDLNHESDGDHHSKSMKAFSFQISSFFLIFSSFIFFHLILFYFIFFFILIILFDRL